MVRNSLEAAAPIDSPRIAGVQGVPLLETDSPLGAAWLGDGRCSFLVWAPHADGVDACILAPDAQQVAMRSMVRGYWHAVVSGVSPDSRYVFELNCRRAEQPASVLQRPDPASRFQPQGVHGPSQVVPSDYTWKHTGWFGRPLADYVIYELHVGTFSPSGSFDGIIPFLEGLQRLGITALELMPVAIPSPFRTPMVAPRASSTLWMPAMVTAWP
jgi:maltooligosyltrehalose trehalohydrolase